VEVEEASIARAASKDLPFWLTTESAFRKLMM